MSAGPGETSPETGAPQTAGINFTGATLSDTGAFPPDSMGTIGPAQFIVAVNGRIRSFNKFTGTADDVLNVDTGVFFNSVMTPPISNNFTSDPRIRYDRLSQRWFISMIDVPGRAGTLPNRIMLAVSDGNIISGISVWTFFYFQQDLVSPAGDTGDFADYPTLGIDAKALYIGVNIFRARNGTFGNTTGFVIRKSSLLGAGPIVVTAFRRLISRGSSTGPFTPQGVDNYDPLASEGYFIGVDNAMYGKLDLRRVSNPGGSPSISANIPITVPTTSGIILVSHLGNFGGANGNLDGLDQRLIAAHFRNGRLWTAANIAVDNTGLPSGTDTRNGIRWYELQGIPTGSTPSVVQSGTLFQPSASNSTDQRSYWMGSMMVSGQGHVAMGFSVAGSNERINAGIAGRFAHDPPRTMRSPTLYTSSASNYNPPSDSGGTGGRRWGDYSYTSLDPNDDMTMWTIQEFCDAENSYGVRVTKLLAPPPAMPISCNPSSVPKGASNVTISVSGFSTNGSGFFDPGIGFSNRISASVSDNGITISNINYIDPTHLTFSATISSTATNSARTISITNPDGQISTSSSPLFTVINGVVSAPPFLSTTNSNGTIFFTWSAVAGQIYRVQYKPDLNVTNWTDLSGDITATNSTVTKSDLINQTQRFYRLEVLP
ncbi:MAG: hypothetical protein M3Y82_10325 [Verrucomicrobiota bacterium]|nr:hypothetical protein [Verrucomicrobiota bacterium]